MKGWIRRMCVLLLGVCLAGSALADEVATQIREHAGAHRLIVLGEYHGTRETPLLVRQLADDYSAAGTPVILALEMPRGENHLLARYLASDGGPAMRRALAGSAFWSVQDNQHDGRRSRDMLDLIEALRLLKEQGRDVRVLGYDVDASSDDNQQRDDEMAVELRRLYNDTSAQTRLLVLAGNVHAMRHRPADAPQEMQQRPMASQLIDLDLYSIRLEPLRGESWGCFGERCRALVLPVRAARAPKVDTALDRMYDLIVWLPMVSLARLVD